MNKSFFIFLIYAFQVIANTAYTCNKVILTNFKNNNEFIDCFKDSYFFEKYLEYVKGDEVEFIPPINKFTKSMNFPQTIQYRAIPDIPYVPSFMLLKINIQHKWKRDENKFIGNVSTKYITFNVNLSTSEHDKKIFMKLEGEIIEKMSIVPNNAMDLLLDQFSGIFQDIIKKRNK